MSSGVANQVHIPCPQVSKRHLLQYLFTYSVVHAFFLSCFSVCAHFLFSCSNCTEIKLFFSTPPLFISVDRNVVWKQGSRGTTSSLRQGHTLMLCTRPNPFLSFGIRETLVAGTGRVTSPEKSDSVRRSCLVYCVCTQVHMTACLLWQDGVSNDPETFSCLMQT